MRMHSMERVYLSMYVHRVRCYSRQWNIFVNIHRMIVLERFEVLEYICQCTLLDTESRSIQDGHRDLSMYAHRRRYIWDRNTDISTNAHMIWYIRCSNPDASTCAHRTRSIRGSNIDESTCLPRLRSIRGIALQDQILDSSGHDCLWMDYVILISMTARRDPSRGKIRKDGKNHYVYVH